MSSRARPPLSLSSSHQGSAVSLSSSQGTRQARWIQAHKDQGLCRVCSQVATRGSFCEEHYWRRYNGLRINIPGRYLKDQEIRIIKDQLTDRIKECGQLAEQIADHERSRRGAVRITTWRTVRSLSAVLRRLREA